MPTKTTTTDWGWRHIERYAYVERPYEDVWVWLGAHLSELGDPLPGGGRSVELRIRPGGVDVSRPVRLHVGGLVAGDDRARASLGWADATHPHLFPHLEAVLEIAPVPNDALPFTQLGVVARYRPPLGRLGAIGDRLVGAEVTDVALTTFLDELVDAVESQTVSPSRHAETESSPLKRVDDDAETRRVLFVVDGLGVRPGGAAGARKMLAALPGVTHVSVDPRTSVVAVDHDPTRCTAKALMAVLEEAGSNS